MIPNKGHKARSEYIKLHYKMQKLYRSKYPYIPFRHIQKAIYRRWQIICYANLIDDTHCKPERIAKLQWSEILEVSETL